MKKKGLTRNGRQALYGMLYILPSFIIIMVFCALAIALAVYFSLTDYSLLSQPKFSGISNYLNVFNSSTFYAALKNTAGYVVVVPIQTVLALLIAVFIAEKQQNRYGSLLRSTIFIPVIISSIAASGVWQVLFRTKDGLINTILLSLGAPEMNWLGNKTLAFVCVCIVTIWKNVGYYMVIYYAGVMGIPREQQEAAIVDGATGFQRFRLITIPNLKPITYMIVTLGVISSFQIFDIVYQLTGGGPGTATITLAYMVYTYAFSNHKIGYASAIAVLLLLFVLLIHWVQNAFFKGKE